jgi:hypothetical protein
METREEVYLEEPAIEAELRECSAAAVVVEGRGCDATFLSTWMAAAVKAQTAWDAAACGADGVLYKDVFYGEILDFGLWAIDFVRCLRANGVAAVLSFAEHDEPHYFALLLGLGFFEIAGDYYRMVIPNDFPATKVKSAATAYMRAAVTDSEGTTFLFPHKIVTTMSLADAKARQRRLKAIQDFRQTDADPSIPRA